MRLVPVGLGVVTGLQVVAAAAAYPILTVGVGLAVSAHGTLISPDPGARTIFFFSGLPMAFGALLATAVFVAVPLGVCVSGAMVVGRLGRRRRAKVSMFQLLQFGAALIVMNVAVLLGGTLIWPVWFSSGKLAALIPLWPLDVGFALNAVLDAVVVGIVLRSQIRTR